MPLPFAFSLKVKMNSISEIFYIHSQLLASQLFGPLLLMVATPANYQSILKKDKNERCTRKKIK